jgi:hypothetical protein
VLAVNPVVADLVRYHGHGRRHFPVMNGEADLRPRRLPTGPAGLLDASLGGRTRRALDLAHGDDIGKEFHNDGSHAASEHGVVFDEEDAHGRQYRSVLSTMVMRGQDRRNGCGQDLHQLGVHELVLVGEVEHVDWRPTEGTSMLLYQAPVVRVLHDEDEVGPGHVGIGQPATRRPGKAA